MQNLIIQDFMEDRLFDIIDDFLSQAAKTNIRKEVDQELRRTHNPCVSSRNA